MPRIPKFKSEKEEAEFWDTRDTLDYFPEEVADLELDPELKKRIEARTRQREKIQIGIRLERRQVSAAKSIADQKGIPYQTLMRMWIQEAINKEGGKQ